MECAVRTSANSSVSSPVSFSGLTVGYRRLASQLVDSGFVSGSGIDGEWLSSRLLRGESCSRLQAVQSIANESD